jgi:hypothetical protein
MAIIKITITDKAQESAYIKWLQDKQVGFAAESQVSYRTYSNSSHDAVATTYCTIHDELVALEFMLAFNGTSVSEQDYKQHLIVHHVGGILSR